MQLKLCICKNKTLLDSFLRRSINWDVSLAHSALRRARWRATAQRAQMMLKIYKKLQRLQAIIKKALFFPRLAAAAKALNETSILLLSNRPADGVKPPTPLLFCWGQPWFAFVYTVFQIYVVFSSLNLTRTLQRQKQYIKKLILWFLLLCSDVGMELVSTKPTEPTCMYQIKGYSFLFFNSCFFCSFVYDRHIWLCARWQKKSIRFECYKPLNGRY